MANTKIVVYGYNAANNIYLPLQIDTSGFLNVHITEIDPSVVFAVGGPLANDADNIAAVTDGLAAFQSYNYLFDGTNFDRQRGQTNAADAVAAMAAGVSALALTAAYGYLFNGATFDRSRNGSAANLSGATQPFAQVATAPGEWAINHTPAANTQATISRAAGGAGVRHVVKSLTVSLIGLAAAAEATVLVNLRDGATGAGTILWSTRLLIKGLVGEEYVVALSGLNIVGTANTAMTLEFAAAGGASTFETVSMTGFDTV